MDLNDLFENRDMVTLHRAAATNGWSHRLFEPDAKLIGTPWYDDLERITDIGIDCRIGARRFTLGHTRDNTLRHAVANALAREPVTEVTVTTTHVRDGESRTRTWQTDFAVADEYELSPLSAGVILLRGANETAVDELCNLIHDAVFEPRDDDEDDSLRTQLEDSREDAHLAACLLLLDETGVEHERIGYSIRHRVAHLIPEGRTVRIVKHRGSDVVDVEVTTS